MNLIKKIKLYFKKYYGLNNIDKKMLEYLNFDNGYFIECGANDGIRQSNTFHYEKEKGWRGVLIEPSYKFNELIKNRSKKNYFSNNCCVSKQNENKEFNFMYYNLMTTMSDDKISKELNINDDYHKIAKKFMTSDEEIHSFKSRGKTLTTILDEAKSPKEINFFSLDVEGSEFEVINGIDFKKYNFQYFLIETKNFDKLSFFLSKKNYKYLKKLSSHDYLFGHKF